MRNKKRILLFALFVLTNTFCFAQIDTCFWFAAPKVCAGHENTPVVLRLSSYGKAADITITEPANPNFKPISTSLSAYSPITVDLTSQLNLGYIENPWTDSPGNYGIKISSTSNIAAYYEVGKKYNPEIFSLKGKIGTGLKFLIPGQTNFTNASGGIFTPQPKNGFVIVATEDNTIVDITPSNDALGHDANVKFTVNLSRGQSYAVIGQSILTGKHLGGSIVKSNNPICVTIYDDSAGLTSAGNWDLIGDQILPEENNGSEFIIVRGNLSFNYNAMDYYYIWATTNGTTILVDGLPVGPILKRGEVYEGHLSNPSAYIVTTNPVYLYQVTGIGGELASTNLPSIKCTGSQLVSFVRSTSEAFYLNLLCKKTEIGNFLLNGNKSIDSSLFSPVPGTTDWMAARLSWSIDNLIQAANTTVISNTSGLFHLGFINGSSGTGSRMGYFSNYSIAVLAPVVIATSCIGDTIKLSCTQISGATYHWRGPNFDQIIYNPVIPNASRINSGMYKIDVSIPGCAPSSDSLPIVVHPLPTASFVHTHDTLCYGGIKNINYTLTGTSPWTLVYSDGVRDSTVKNVVLSSPYFPVSPVTNTIYSIKNVTDSNACAISPITIKSINEDTVVVNPLPRATIDSVFCAATGKLVTILLTGKSPWNLIYSLGNDSTTINQITTPIYSFAFTSTTATPLKIISVSDANGCVNDTLKQSAILYPQPHASFGVSSEVCLRDTTVFSDSSDGKGNAIVKWRWNFGDSGMDTIQNPRHRYVTADTDSVKLFVFTNKGCSSDTITKATVVNPLPLAGFSFSSPLCETRQILFTDNSKANVGTLTAWNWNMGNLDTNLTGNAPFTEIYPAWGNDTVRLAVQNSKGCKSDTAVVALNIHPLPHPGFTMPEICLNDKFAKFVDTSSIADGSKGMFTYQWNFNSGSPAVIKAPVPLTDTAKNPTIQFNDANNYLVSLKVTSTDGCVDSTTQPFTVNGAKPSANFTISQATPLCSNDSVRIKDMSTVNFGSITTVLIYWDNSSTVYEVDSFPTSGMEAGKGKTYSHLYPNDQLTPTLNHYIKFIAYSGNSCVSPRTNPVTLNQSPLVQFNTIPGICNDTTARPITQATETRNVSPESYLYSGTGVDPKGVYTPQSVLPDTYPIKYLYTSSAGCKDSATQPITVWPSPMAKWGISTPDCERHTITFTDSSLANYKQISNWYWDFGDGDTILHSAIPFTKIYAAANSYKASLRVMTDSGCRSAYNIQTIKVNYVPVVNFVLPTAICLPDGKGKFTNTSTIGDKSEEFFSYLWNFGDANDPSASTLQNPTHQYTALVPYTVHLKITSKDGCTDSLSQSLSQVYPQPKADFSALPTTACVNDVIAFTDQSNGITSSVIRWIWDLAEGNTSAAQNTSRQFKDSGTFTISLSIYNSQGCVSDTALKEVTVYPYPKLTMGPGRVVLQGGVIALIPQYSYGTSLQYLWTPSTYLNSDSAAHPLASPPEDIQYKLTLTGIGNCTVYDSVTITVLKTPMIPNAFSPNGDGINDEWSIKYLESYPGCTVDVYDRYGQVVFHSIGYSTNWDGKRKGVLVPIGTYYYLINPKNGRPIMSGSVTIIR